jgi:hypothetical protein
MTKLFKRGERKLNEGEGKKVYVQVLTTFNSQEPETRVALGKRSIRAYPRGLGGGCFNERVDADLDGAQESNQQAFGSLEPGSTFCRQPIAPM